MIGIYNVFCKYYEINNIWLNNYYRLLKNEGIWEYYKNKLIYFLSLPFMQDNVCENSSKVALSQLTDEQYNFSIKLIIVPILVYVLCHFNLFLLFSQFRSTSLFRDVNSPLSISTLFTIMKYVRCLAQSFKSEWKIWSFVKYFADWTVQS